MRRPNFVAAPEAVGKAAPLHRALLVGTMTPGMRAEASPAPTRAPGEQRSTRSGGPMPAASPARRRSKRSGRVGAAAKGAIVTGFTPLAGPAGVDAREEGDDPRVRSPRRGPDNVHQPSRKGDAMQP